MSDMVGGTFDGGYSLSTPDVTTSFNDSHVFSCYFHRTGWGTLDAPPSGYLLLGDIELSGRGIALAHTYKAVAGLEDPGDWSFTGQTGDEQRRVTVGMRGTVAEVEAKTVVYA